MISVRNVSVSLLMRNFVSTFFSEQYP